MSRREIRRMAGVLSARLPELALHQVEDPRTYAKRWGIGQILGTVLLGLMAGGRNLGEAEELSARLSVGVRRLLHLPRRLADTTMRDVLCKVSLESLRAVLHRLIKSAWRRKALPTEGLPFHVVSLDGKATAVACFDQVYVQRHVPEHGLPYGLARTVTCALVSAPGRPCIDAIPIPASTNEMGHFQACFASLLETYGDLFQMITYDAGALSDENAGVVVAAGKDYLLRLRGEQRNMYKVAEDLLDPQEVVARTVDVLDNQTTVTRRLVLVGLQSRYGPDPSSGWVWRHARTFVRVESIKVRGGVVTEGEVRMYVSSLPLEGLRSEQWLLLVRRHWAVENNNHNVLDTAFEEDDRPWITADPHGVLAVMLLRRVAHSLLTLFRSVTQRSEEARAIRWKALLRWVRDTLVAAAAEDLEALRTRKVTAVLG